MNQRRFDYIVLLIYAVAAMVLFHDFLGTGNMLLAYDQTGGSLQWRQFMVDAIKTYGSIPWWDPYMFGGMPFIGVLHGDILYPTTLFRLFLPVHVVMNWVFIIHGIIAGALTYFFAKNRMKAPVEVAFLAGLSYMFTASLMSLSFAGHDGKFIVASLLPGVIYAVDRGMETGRLAPFAVGGLLLGLDFLSPHAQLAYYSYLAAGIWFLFALAWRWRDGVGWPGLLKRVGWFAVMALLGLAVSAAQFLPAFYYAQHFGPRVGKGYEYAVSWSLPPSDLISAFFPKFSGWLDSYWGPNVFKHNAEYIGAFAFLFSVVAVWLRPRKRMVIASLSLTLFFVLIALGGYTPLYKLFYYILPGIKKFRAPGMAFIVASFFFNVLAVQGLLAVQENAKALLKKQKKLLIAIGVVGALGILLFMLGSSMQEIIASLFHVQDKAKLAALAANYSMIPNGVLRGAVLAGVLWFVAGWWTRKSIKPIWFAGIMGAAVLFDLWTVDKDFIKPYTNETGLAVAGPSYFPKDQAIAFLQNDQDVFRVMPMFWHMSDNYLMHHNIENMAGHHGQQLKRYMELLEDTLGTIMFDPRACPNLLSHPDFTDILNVKYVVSVPLPRDLSLLSPDQARAVAPLVSYLNPDHFQLVRAWPQLQIYQNKRYLPRVFMVEEIKTARGNRGVLDAMKGVDLHKVAVFDLDDGPGPDVSDPGSWSASIKNYQPNKIVIKVESQNQGFMVYSGNWYPFWRAKIDGQQVRLHRVDYTLMGLSVPPGQHTVELFYDPVLEKWGMLISGLSLLFIGLVLAVPAVVNTIRKPKQEAEK